MAAVLVHIDLDGDRPHASSLQALAAGRTVASSWGATLYAALVLHAPERPPSAGPTRLGNILRVPGDARAVEAVRAALARGGADKIVVALTDAPIQPLWSALGAAWQTVLDHLRPRLVLFGASAPSASELGPRTGARIGARLMIRARTVGSDEIELRDRDGSYVRAGDSGAAVALVGAAAVLPAHTDDDIDVMVLSPAGSADPTVELAGTAPAELSHTTGTLLAIGDDAASDPAVVKATKRLAKALGAHVIGGAAAARAGALGTGAVVEARAALAPELCIAIGAPAVELAGATTVIRIGGGGSKGVDAALGGSIAANLGELVRGLGESR